MDTAVKEKKNIHFHIRLKSLRCGHYLRFRPKKNDGEYYQASIGRFITSDSYLGRTVDPQSLHRYNYVTNNPANFTDPWGFRKKASQQQVGTFHTMAVPSNDIKNKLLTAGLDIDKILYKLNFIGGDVASLFAKAQDPIEQQRIDEYRKEVLTKAGLPVDQTGFTNVESARVQQALGLEEKEINALRYAGAMGVPGYEAFAPTVALFEFENTIELVARAKFYNPDNISNFDALKNAIIGQFSESFNSNNILGTDKNGNKISKSITAQLIDLGIFDSSKVQTELSLSDRQNRKSAPSLGKDNNIDVVIANDPFRSYEISNQVILEDTSAMGRSGDFRFVAMHEFGHAFGFPEEYNEVKPGVCLPKPQTDFLVDSTIYKALEYYPGKEIPIDSLMAKTQSANNTLTPGVNAGDPRVYAYQIDMISDKYRIRMF